MHIPQWKRLKTYRSPHPGSFVYHLCIKEHKSGLDFEHWSFKMFDRGGFFLPTLSFLLITGKSLIFQQVFSHPQYLSDPTKNFPS